MPQRETDTDAEGATFERGCDDSVLNTAGEHVTSHARRGLMRLRHTRRVAESPGSEARIEVLGDRIELLEYTLNEYIDKIDAVATHATRISVDRLLPAVEKLSRVISETRHDCAEEGAVPDPAAPSAKNGVDAEVRSLEDMASRTDEAADISERLLALETRIASLPDRIRIAAASPLPSPEMERRTRSHIFSALSALSRQQDELKDHISARLDALEGMASSGDGHDVSARIAGCEQELARIPETVRMAAAATLPDLDALTRAVDALRDTIDKGEERQAEAHAALLNRLREIEGRQAQTDEGAILARLDAVSADLAKVPERITMASAPPALTGTAEQRGAIARAFSALSALTRQQEQLTAMLGERLDTLENSVAAGQQTRPDLDVEAVARKLKDCLQDTVRPGPSLDASMLLRTTQSGDRKTAVALARIERVLAALAAKDTAEPKALTELRAESQTRATRVLDAIAQLRTEMREGFADVTPVDVASQTAVHAALAELLALAQRDAAHHA